MHQLLSDTILQLQQSQPSIEAGTPEEIDQETSLLETDNQRAELSLLD